MSKEEDNCKIGENCSSGTCAPVSPFSKEGKIFLIFILLLAIILFSVLYLNGYI